MAQLKKESSSTNSSGPETWKRGVRCRRANAKRQEPRPRKLPGAKHKLNPEP
jgi:hypothetical protein